MHQCPQNSPANCAPVSREGLVGRGRGRHKATSAGENCLGLRAWPCERNTVCPRGLEAWIDSQMLALPR